MMFWSSASNNMRGVMLIFRTFLICFLLMPPEAQAHLHRAHVCDAYALTKTVIIIEPTRSFKDRDDFFKTMATDPQFAAAYTRCIGRAVDRFKALKTGFRLEFSTDELGKFVVKLIAPPFKVTKQAISLNMPYNPFHSFRDILTGKSKKDTRLSKYTVMFRSFSGNVLLIPRKGYVSFYDFSKKASTSEISDLWAQALVISTELNKHKKAFIFTTHAGTAGGQKVPHLHLRFELQK